MFTAFLGRLMLRQKFLLLALLGCVAVAIPTALFLNEANKSVAIAQQEADGIVPARALLAVVQLVQQHRGLAAMALAGDAASRAPATAKLREADQAFAQMERQVQRLAERDISAAWFRILEQWSALSAQDAQGALAASDSFARHSALIAQLFRFNDSVIDHAGLRLDPEPDSYFLIDALLVRAPVLRETLGQLRGAGAGMLVRGAASMDERIAIAARAGLAADYYRTIDDGLAIALAHNGDLRTRLADLARGSRTKGDQVLRLAHEQVVQPPQLSYSALAWYRQFSDTIDTQHRLAEAGLDALQQVLAARVASQRQVEAVLVGAVLLLCALAVALGHVIIRSVTRPLGQALDAARVLTAGASDKIEAAGAIARGDLERRLAVAPLPVIALAAAAQDEVGQLQRSVMRMGQVQSTLDQAFLTMLDALRDSRQQGERRDWIMQGQNELNMRMRGELETAVLADRVLSYLCPRIGAGAGACYLYDEANAQLRPVAAYGLPPAGADAAPLALGEGVLGQAVLERRTIVLDQVPSGYLTIASALGRATPACVVVVPLLHGANVVGALEAGAFRPYSEAELAWLELVRESVAISFDVGLSRQRTRALLAETERQAEELRMQQEELQQSNEELEERADLLERQREQIRAKNAEVEQASREIWHKAEELQRISAYKSEFLANMSHELRTPLNSMLILSGLLRDNRPGNLTPEQTEYASTIHAAGKDLLNLINDILDLAKVEAGQVECHYEDGAPAAMLAALDNLFRPAAEQKGLRLSFALDPAVPPRLRLDVQHTAQVLRNLLGNAIKFTARGEVALHVSVAPAQEGRPPMLACAVSDTGIGVPEGQQQLIFEAFRQADGGISRHYGGTGLGLSISLQLANRMGGSLSLHSVAGQGSTFTLLLPLQAAQGDAPDITATAPSPLPGMRGADGKARMNGTGGAVGAAVAAGAIGAGSANAAEGADGVNGANGTSGTGGTGGTGGAAPRDPAAPWRALVLEDRPAAASSLCSQLATRGIAAMGARDAAQAQAVLAGQRVGCVVLDLDLELAGVPAPELLAQVQQLAGQPLPVVLHAARALDAEQQRSLRQHADSIVLRGERSAERLADEVALCLHAAARRHAVTGAATSASPALAGDAPFEGRKMLIVDDDMRNVFSLTSLLTDKGAVVVEAENGKEALRQLEQHPDVCVVLMDIMMPEMDGYETMRAIRAQPRHRTLPLIAMTAKAMQGDSEKCMAAGASDYIAKPLDTAKLLSLLRVWTQV
ncbi:response regulator [Duganella sp. LX20W]|uniref:Virulence sensor protein BvgS n=1 Tax=Rugamonas brunnea TaxID=2758569 RepID=A0A7W2EVA7_9BURK|nr:response regulator [Rugamonas brunnea]MBA5639264.1 response regulator [Rugamonas brunnea]